MDDKMWKVIYREGFMFAKILGTIKGFVKRMALLLSIHKYTFVFIHREATPFGPPLFEWMTSKIFRKRIIYDFDDAIWKRDYSNANRLAAWLKQPGKVKKICGWSFIVSAGNRYLSDYAREVNSNVIINPTIVDTDNYHNKTKDQQSRPVNIGWTGTQTTIKYLSPLIPMLESLHEQHQFVLYVICNEDPNWDKEWITFVPWSKKSEIADLLQFHIGLMPLPDDEWANGKCGFKAIQYMALGIVPVASAVGVNSQLITHNSNGLLIRNEADWLVMLASLLNDEELRNRLAVTARAHIENSYSVAASKEVFLSTMEG